GAESVSAPNATAPCGMGEWSTQTKRTRPHVGPKQIFCAQKGTRYGVDCPISETHMPRSSITCRDNARFLPILQQHAALHSSPEAISRGVDDFVFRSNGCMT